MERCWSTRLLLMMGGGWGRQGEVLVDEGVADDGGGWGRHGEVLVDEVVAGDGRWVGSTWRGAGRRGWRW
jgi:hypothetical protein